MKQLLHWLIPPDNWKPTVSVLMGLFVGLGVYAFYISKAPSYLSDNPETCINCHVMNPQFNDWAHSSHRTVATCNDCHVPHDNLVHKYLFKMQDGLRHATIYTFRAEAQSIYILDEGKKAVQENCIRCHKRVVGMEYMIAVQPNYQTALTHRTCLDCHRETPHSRVNSIASTPNALVKTNLESRTEREEEEEE
ncbi:MAG: cytochrome c nitrite reductase small subunit [Bacteroidetes bacterium]|nr:MAG: cytochrome c nitrite reductase small subunit [Bacteroidota bacterium]